MNAVPARRRLGLLLALAATGLAGAAPARALQRGDRLVPPPLPLLDGRRLRPQDWAGQAWVLSFFTLDCPYCQRHNARLDTLSRRMAGQGLQVLGVTQDQPEAVREHLQRHGLGFAATAQGATLRALVTARRIVPFTAVIDGQGVVRELIPGEMSDDDVQGLARWAQPSGASGPL
ncbi:TlpA family protein disulfide reductase [Ideonella sp. 4Y16]|uniref:TlpA disulfide reductase family protein n=1 Tax=Ideonella alba TaxID=2824118 RepID=UPI001B370C72|nr:TlpA disulfide reductase family protein [Ideonella alba]MBQ0944918.1 TlpA family protein disulfide reductase [Ideonella alba]